MGNLKTWRNVSLLVVLATSFATAIFAQEFTGRVSDQSGAALPSTAITVRNQLTGVSVNAMTTKEGLYTVPYLKPGLYTVSVTAQGFKPVQKTDITLQVGQSASVDFALEVGSVTESISVQASPLIDVSANRGEVVENERVTELPLNGRDPDMLAILNPGAVWIGQPQWQRPFDNTMANLTVNGGQTGSNELMIDNAPNESADGNGRSAYVPPVDAVQEFKIITNPYDAQYGRAAGGVMQMILKSGTNTLHGDAYEFARRTFLDANYWQNNYYGGSGLNARPVQKLDQWGSELDGPVRIPKVYNGIDKLFFLLQYENWNEIVPSTTVSSVPSPQWLTGDYSNLVYWTGSGYAPITIYDPLTLHNDANGNPVRDPFPGNIIPSSRLNPVSQAFLKYFPAPNATPASGQNPFANNYVASTPTTDLYRNALGKLDYNLGAKDKFSLRYGYWIRFETRSSNGFPNAANDGQLPGGTRSHTFTTEWIHTFTPNLLFSFDANVVVRADFQVSGTHTFDVSSLGWTDSELSQFNTYGKYSDFPNPSFNEFQQLGNWGTHLATGESLNMLPNLTFIKGRHTLHAGLDMRLLQLGTRSQQGVGAWFNTDRTWTQANYNPNASDPASGNDIAAWQLGWASQGGFNLYPTDFLSQHYYALFLQDDWKVTRKLTLNLGVRWDLNGPQVERHNEMNYAFNLNATNPVDAMVNHSLLPGDNPIQGVIQFAGAGGNPRPQYALNNNNIQPRVGFAYQLDSKTVLRGGVGEMFLNPTPGIISQVGWSASTPYVPSLDNWQTPNPNANLSDPFPTVIQPLGAASGPLTGLGTGMSFMNPHYKMPNFWTFSFGAERQLARNDVIEISYAGSRTIHLDNATPGQSHSPYSPSNPGAYNWNAIPMSWYNACNPELGGDPNTCPLLTSTPANPFYQVAAFAGTGYSDSQTISNTILARPYPAFGDITEYHLNSGRSWYNSLQVAGSHRWNKALTVHGTWTWSKNMVAGGFTDTTFQQFQNRTIDAQDRTQRITLSGVYLLPIGSGRPLLTHANRYIDAVIGGWELSPLYIYETGAPWMPTGLEQLHPGHVSRAINSLGYIRSVAPCVGFWSYNDNNQGKWTLDPEPYSGGCQQLDYVANPPYSAQRNIVYTGVRLPNYQQFDANLSKNFNVWERVKLQLRLEAFNVLNHPLWQVAYNSSPSDSNFGTIERGPTSQSNLPRQGQIALKVTW